MRKRIISLVILILIITSVLFAATYPVKAQTEICMIGPKAFQTTYVNQPVNLTAIPYGGTPPYTFQWYVDDSAIEGATNATFQFVENSPGQYNIALMVNDSAGKGDYDSFPPGGVWVFVQPAPTPSPTPTPPPPSISLISPENKNYTIATADLNFSLSAPAQWIAYSLDSQANITLAGNVTLTGLSSGQHTLTIYANDTYGNNATPQTVTFTVSPPITFPTTEAVAVAATASVIVGVGGGLGYILKVKTKK
jgi:hypothetical protein